ncbi:MAG TPA: hypothetical protein VES40_17490 [Ilumatobacteraceae bacterium]|nr:hypothetical protein [Ilumatobacteraceae bacterium]
MVISVVFVFLAVSLVVSGINEGLNELFAIRSKVLWQAIDDISRHVDTPRRILRLRDVLAELLVIEQRVLDQRLGE